MLSKPFWCIFWLFFLTKTREKRICCIGCDTRIHKNLKEVRKNVSCFYKQCSNNDKIKQRQKDA